MKAAKASKVAAPDDASNELAASRSTHRSPNFPFISLEKAIERARQLHDAEGRHAVRVDVAAKHWGYNLKSSGVLQTVGALRMYGLISVEAGAGLNRTIRLTDRALRVLLDKRPEEYRKALIEAALAPKIFADLWGKWGGSMPSNENAESHLTVDLGFNPATAPNVFAAYKKTVEFAQPPDSASLSGVAKDSGDEGEQDMTPDQTTRGHDSTAPPQPKRVPVAVAMQDEEEHFRLKLAGGRTVRVLFQGEPPTQAEIGKLIQLLELQKDQYPEE